VPDSAGDQRLPFPRQLVELCEDRAKTPLGSTRGDDATRNFSEKPLFSTDPSLNPTFHDWNVVFFRYCDGSSFASSAGHANVQAVLRHLQQQLGFGRASQVVVSGCSAGAVAASLHASAVSRAAPTAKVAALLDSGVFPDWSREADESAPAGIWPLHTQLRQAFAGHRLEHEARVVPRACLEAHADAPWRCFFLEHLLPHMQVPAFVLQSRYDSSNVRDVAEAEGLAALGDGVAWRLDQALSHRREFHGVFLDSCFHHCMSWGQLAAGSGHGGRGATQPEAFAAWWRDHIVLQQKAPHQGVIPMKWDHWAQRAPGEPGPSWERDRCPDAEADLTFWKRTFASHLVGQ